MEYLSLISQSMAILEYLARLSQFLDYGIFISFYGFL